MRIDNTRNETSTLDPRCVFFFCGPPIPSADLNLSNDSDLLDEREREKERESNKVSRHGYHHVLFLIDFQRDSQVSSKLKFKPIK